jgi:hypothetical protein
VRAVLCLDQGLVKEIGEIIYVPICPQDHITTTPPIAAVWTAFRHELLSSKTDTPASAVARLRKNFHPIDEHV